MFYHFTNTSSDNKVVYPKVKKSQLLELPIVEEAEWEEYFRSEAAKLNAIKSQIDTTDKAIDAMLYALYGLSDEEISIVEQS